MASQANQGAYRYTSEASTEASAGYRSWPSRRRNPACQ